MEFTYQGHTIVMTEQSRTTPDQFGNPGIITYTLTVDGAMIPDRQPLLLTTDDTDATQAQGQATIDGLIADGRITAAA